MSLVAKDTGIPLVNSALGNEPEEVRDWRRSAWANVGIGTMTAILVDPSDPNEASISRRRMNYKKHLILAM